jgi:hypothetical protein
MTPGFSWFHRHPHDICFGYTGWGRLRPVRWPAADRAKHLHVLGATGEGKSKFIEGIVTDTIASGLGLCVIDPHSQLIDDILRHLLSDGVLDDPAIRARIIYFRPARTDYILPFNPLNTPETRYDTISNILEAFKRTWPKVLEEAPRFDEIVTAALIALHANRLTLMHMRRFLTSADFRSACLQHVDDAWVVEFFTETYAAWGPREAAIYTSSTLNKVSAFSFNPVTRLILGQPDNVLDLKAIMDSQKILLVDLGHLPGLTRRLVGGLVVTFIEQAMRRRASRTLWQLVVDEFAQFVANDGSAQGFADILSEARKFGVGLIASHQQTDQIPDTVRSGLKNAYTKIVFSVDWEDAARMSHIVGRVQTETIKQEAKTETQQAQLKPYVEQWGDITESIRSLPERRAYVATRKKAGIPFQTPTIRPYTATAAQVEQIKRESLARYGIPYAVAQQHLAAHRDEETALLPVPVFGK